MGNDWSATRTCDCVNGCYEKDKHTHYEIEYQRSFSSYDDFASCCSDDGLGPHHTHHCPFPKSELEAKTEGIEFEDLAKLRNYFDLDAHWTELFDIVTPGGVKVKQLSQCGLFGYDEYMTIVHAKGITAEQYFASQVDLEYMCSKNDMIQDHEILWQGVHNGMHRTTQFQNLIYPYVNAQRQYLIHADSLPRQQFAGFPHTCYCKCVIGVPSEIGNHMEKLQQYSFSTSYMKWVCWEDDDGLHIVSWMGEDPGWFGSVVKRVQPQLVPGAIDGAIQSTKDYPDQAAEKFMVQLIDQLQSHGIEIPEKQPSLKVAYPRSPGPPQFLSESKSNKSLGYEPTFQSVEQNVLSPRQGSNDTTALATNSDVTPRSS